MPKERKAILFQLLGQDGGFCLRPDQFSRAEWVETPEPEWRGSYRRVLKIQLGRVEVTVERVGEDS